MKSFTDLFIKRPVLAIVVSLVILIAGLQAMKTINVRQYPRSDIAAITVTTIYVGADAELVHGAFEIKLRREQSVVGHQLESRFGPQLFAAGVADSCNHNYSGRFADRLGIFEFHVEHSSA